MILKLPCGWIFTLTPFPVKDSISTRYPLTAPEGQSKRATKNMQPYTDITAQRADHVNKAAAYKL
jgi:hypothetical protein